MTQPAPTSPTQATISMVRLMRLRADAETGEPARVVAHVQAVGAEGAYSVFGKLTVDSSSRDSQVSDGAWTATERLIERLPGVSIDTCAPSSVEQALGPVLQEVEAQVRENLAARRAPGRGTMDRATRNAVRLGINLVRRRPLRPNPERNLADLVGTRAVTLALHGIVTSAATGERAGEFDDGEWFTGELQSFYDEHLESVNRYAVAPEPSPPSIDGRPANSFKDAECIAPLPKDGTKGHLLEREALAYGLSSERFPNGTFVVYDHEGRQMNFKWGRSPIASGVSLSICSYKEATRRLLKRVDVPVPAGRVFSVADIDKALDYADRIGYPVVCKPVAGLRGIGVVADIRTHADLVQALELYQRSELGADDFVIEQHVPGADYRIVVINGEVVASVVREPASVVGDGVHTVADLVEYKNRARKLNPHLSSRPIVVSDAMGYQLAHSGHTLSSVPAAGQKVIVANSANLSQGGDSFEVAHELHPSIKDVAVRAVEAVPGLGFCGLDMLIEDRTKSVDEQRATVIELNAHAAIGSAQYPMWGTPTPVAQLFFEASARAYGIQLTPERADTLSVQIDVRGGVGGVRYSRWVRRYAERLGVVGSIVNVSDRRVRARLDGSADAVSALIYLASRGPRGTNPTSVTTTHIKPFEAEGFDLDALWLGRVQAVRVARRVIDRARSRGTRAAARDED